MKRICLQCGSKVRGDRFKGLFCTQRCAVKWAIEKADNEQYWCDDHGWYRTDVCSSCELLDELDKEWPKTGWCPECRNANNLVPQLQFFYIEDFDDGMCDAHGRIFFDGWHCTQCSSHYWPADIYQYPYEDDDYEERAERQWQEAWRKLGIDHITISCSGSKPSFHRVLETAPARQLSSRNEVAA